MTDSSTVIRSDETTSVSGVNVAGYLTAESGVGTAARGYVKALQSLGIEVALNDVEIGVDSRRSDSTFTQFASNNPFPVNLICVNADQVPAFVEKFHEPYFQEKYNIGAWWWEMTDFPEEWWESFKYFDEIWVGSSYVQQSLAKASPVPVVLVPPVVLAEGQRSLTREKAGVAADDFVFLSMFDFLSGFERKNPLAVIEAFKKAFPENGKVRLLLKFINSDRCPEKATQLVSAAQGAKVTLIERYLAPGENQDLIEMCDAYVSLHRAEGLGLPLAEAMLHGKPVVATAWSGNMDFTTIANSYLTSYKLVANLEDAHPYKIAETWAEADIEHAAILMRQIYDDRADARKRANQGAVDAANRFGIEGVASVMQVRLNAIRAFHPNLIRQDQTLERAISYQLDELTERRLKMIERLEDSSVNPAQDRGKLALRRIVLPLIEKSGYLNSIYSKLFRKVFTDTSRAKTQIDLIDARTRRMLADANARIARLEKEIAQLKGSEPS